MNRTYLFAPVLALATATAAAGVQWQPHADDLRAGQLIDPAQMTATSINTNRDSIRFSWNLDRGPDDAPALTAVSGHRASSRQYWVDTTSARLARGVELPLSAPGAVIRISPLEATGRVQFDPGALTLAMDGRPLDNTRDLALIASGTDLSQARMAVPEGTLAFRLAARAGFGTLTVSARAAGAADALPLVLHVHEPDSPYVATLALPRLHFLAGDRLRPELALEGAPRLAAADVQAVITSPDLTQMLTLRQRAGAYEVTLPAAAAGRPGEPWEARFQIDTTIDGVRVRRDVQAAFSLALPVARFNGSARLAGSDDRTGAKHPAVTLGLDVARAGRYQVGGVLWGTAPDGSLQPVAQGQSAAWLPAGNGDLYLGFDQADLTGFGAPWAIRDLRLSDQGRLGLLEQRVGGLRLNR